MNVLFVTLDQFRGDSYSAAGHPLVRTPILDRIAAEGVRLSRHYSQAAPCSPGRAAIYTGTYQMNNRVVANGTPLRSDLENMAIVARRAGFDPTLFGYTDQGIDPNRASGDDDPRLESYDGILPGFSIGLYLPESQAGWIHELRARGFQVPSGWAPALRGEAERPAEISLSAFLTTRFLEWLGMQESGWFAHLSYLRPHPPYVAAGEFSKMYEPADVALPISPSEPEKRHSIHEIALGLPGVSAPTNLDDLRRIKAQYFGMISEVDSQLGRVVRAIEDRGEWGETLVVVTSDHGEQLGDHGLLEKLGFFPQSYHVIGLWRDPRSGDAGRVVERFTENIDLLPSLAQAMGEQPPVQCDGRTLQTLFADPDCDWRNSAHYEWDFRNFFLNRVTSRWPMDRTLSRQNLAVSLNDSTAYVQFGDGTFRCFDLAADPTWRTEVTDDGVVLRAAQEQLLWRQEHMDRELTDMLLSPGRPGRWPSELLTS